MVRPVLLALALSTLVGTAARSDGRKLMPYSEVRAMLQHLGYNPYFMPGADVCDPNDPRCFPELESCARSRTWACTYTWRRGRAIIEVGTQYESLMVTRSECIVNCSARDVTGSIRPRSVASSRD